MSENLTVCPDCGAEFETEQMIKDMPLQALEQVCPDCENSIGVAIINYPNSTYEVVGPALKGDTCNANGGKCCDAAMIRTQRVGEPIKGMCARHIGAHRESALDFRSEL